MLDVFNNITASGVCTWIVGKETHSLNVIDDNPLEINYNINEKIVVPDLPYYISGNDLEFINIRS